MKEYSSSGRRSCVYVHPFFAFAKISHARPVIATGCELRWRYASIVIDNIDPVVSLQPRRLDVDCQGNVETRSKFPSLAITCDWYPFVIDISSAPANIFTVAPAIFSKVHPEINDGIKLELSIADYIRGLREDRYCGLRAE